MDPPVSDPKAANAMSAATAAAEPPLDPPGTRSKSQGFRAVPKAEVSQDDPKANSSMLHWPRIVAPLFLNRSITVASYGATCPFNMLDPHVTSASSTQILSLTATGTPPNVPCLPAFESA